MNNSKSEWFILKCAVIDMYLHTFLSLDVLYLKKKSIFFFVSMHAGDSTPSHATFFSSSSFSSIWFKPRLGLSVPLMLLWKLSMLEILLPKKLTANCITEIRSKLRELILAAMVLMMAGYRPPIGLQQSLYVAEIGRTYVIS